MKTSRITLAALLLLVLAAMTSCEQGKEKGVAMGAEFAKAWTGDDQALDQQVLKVTAALDSLTFKSAFADAFIAEAGKSDSTVALAARVLVKDGATVTGDLCSEIIDGLASGSITYTQANARVMQLFEVCGRLKKDDLAQAFGAQLDSEASSLPLEKQMKVYSSATAPEKLGAALKADSQAPNADQALINRQVEALKGIYSAQDYKKFIDSFKK